VVELERRRFLVAHRQQDADPFLTQPMSHEAQHVGRRPVEPVRIVDRHHGRRLGGRRAKHTQRSTRHADAIRGTFARRAHERQLQRETLRLGERVERLLRDALEQVAQPEERD
jgi:hypothetical protein